MPIRLLLLCVLILRTAAVARADDPRDLLTWVQTTISGRLPLLAEGTLQTRYQGDNATTLIACCRRVTGGSVTETWAYHSQPQSKVPPFFMVFPNELVDPLEPVIVTAPANGNGAITGSSGEARPAGTLRALGKERIDSTDCDVVEITEPPAQINQLATFLYPATGGPITVKSLVRKLYIGPDGLVHRISGEVSWTEEDNGPHGKGAPPPLLLHNAQFVLNVTAYRKAITFAPHPDSQPPTLSIALKQDGDQWPPTFALSEDGRLLALGSQNGDIHLVDTRTSQERGVLKGHWGRLTALAFSPDAKRLVSADSLVMAVWNLEADKLLYTLHDQPDVYDLIVAPDGKSVLAMGNNRPVQLWDLATGQKRHTFDKLQSDRFTFSPDGAYLAALSGSQVMLWNTKTWQSIEIEGNVLTAFGQIAFSPDSARLALGGHNGVLTLWDARTGRKLQELKGASGSISAVWFSSDGRTITALDRDQRGDLPDNRTGLTTWDTTSWQVTGALNLNGGNPVRPAGGASAGNTFVFRDRLGQLDDAARCIKFWPFPILAVRR